MRIGGLPTVKVSAYCSHADFGEGVAVVGGASGLGEATARHLSREGSTVVVADRDEKRGSIVAEEIGGTSCL